MELEGADLLTVPRSDEHGSTEPQLRCVEHAIGAAWLQRLLLVGYICLWYVISIGLTLYHKWFFSIYGFAFPLLTTSYHFVLKLPLARLGMWAFGIPRLPWRRRLAAV